jgi:8-oxo-dGTP pyrophosphatase MutT (NUDIX family)
MGQFDNPEDASANKILTGEWSEDIKWEFYISEHVPTLELCSAVACIAILKLQGEDDKLVLTRNYRGWEMLGGHIEEGEDVETAMRREAYEEGGFEPATIIPFGYRKILATKPVPHDQREGYYPFPVSYVPHSIAISNSALMSPKGEEVFEAKAFSFDKIKSLTLRSESVILAGIQAYRGL